MKKFDLNIEKVLEDWEVYHALREIIANAIDEQILTNTKDIQIFSDQNKCWHIRDFGRGLKYEHLTQNESKEKQKNSDKVIGKFGVGLKDAFATFDRKGIKFLVKSKYGDISLGYAPKEDFSDVQTLHAFISTPSTQNFIGTEFVFENLKQDDVDKAKDFFLRFSNEILLEATKFGQVLKTNNKLSRIYIHGVRVAEEQNFLFSYNITSLTSLMRKALNRERTHVGRTAYTDRIKTILLECQTKEVAELLVKDLEKFAGGTSHDELTWIDVSVHACKLLNSKDKVIFLTSFEIDDYKNIIDSAKNDGYRIIVIPETVKDKIKGLKDLDGNPIRDLTQYTDEYNQSFEYKFVDPSTLTISEKAIYEKTNDILALIGGKPKIIREILISETMRPDILGEDDTEGVWEPDKKRIIIKRDQLKSLKRWAGTLLHEVTHAVSDAPDVDRDFEQQLTIYLGILAAKNLS